MEELSAYELKRLQTIKENALAMAALGITDAVHELRAISSQPPKPKAKRKPKAPVVAARRRSSGRLAGDAPMDDVEIDENDAAVQVENWRDPNDVGQMTAFELRKWCANLLEDELQKPWVLALTDEQRGRVVKANEEWFGPFTEFTARFGSANEGPLSKTNLKSVVQKIMKLVSGAGITCDKREGSFAEGRPLRLGVTAEEVDQLRAEAQLWCPLPKSAPADLVGRIVDGVVVPRKPPSTGPHDTSNGWLLNHPLQKMQDYKEHLLARVVITL